MSAALLDGRELARKIAESLKPRVEAVESARGRPPRLLIVGPATDAASRSYRLEQAKACKDVGIATESAEKLPSDLGAFDAVMIDRLSGGSSVLPPEKDVEGATPQNLGRLFAAKAYSELRQRRLVAPCTALAIAELLRETRVPLAGKTAVVLGRSNIVGKPAAHLLSCLDLTVTLCHSKTRGLPALAAAADVVVAAMGKAKMVKEDWLKQGAIVIDAGVNADGKRLCGDVDPQAQRRASFYTPVPGGVGPVTTAMLLANTVTLAERALGARR